MCCWEDWFYSTNGICSHYTCFTFISEVLFCTLSRTNWDVSWLRTVFRQVFFFFNLCLLGTYLGFLFQLLRPCLTFSNCLWKPPCNDVSCKLIWEYNTSIMLFNFLYKFLIEVIRLHNIKCILYLWNYNVGNGFN